MPYYDTIEEDLVRAKEILAKGRLTERDLTELELPPLMREHIMRSSGTIFGADVYPAYKLLESFVAEIERLRTPDLCRNDAPHYCPNCDRQGAFLP